LEAGGSVGKVGALSWKNSIGGSLVALRGARRSDVIVVAAVFVVGEEDYRVLPVGAIAKRVEYLGNIGFASLNVGGGMLIVFKLAAEQAEIRVEEDDFGKRRRAGCSCGLCQEDG
jgi:hypothetical protein